MNLRRGLLSLVVTGLLCGQAAAAEPIRRISMDFENAELKVVLKLLSQQSGMNFVASEEAESKPITVYLDNVAVEDAIYSIVKANDLRYELRPGSHIFLVYTGTEEADMQTRVFPLRYLRLSLSAIDVGGKSVIQQLVTREDVTAFGGAQGGGPQPPETEEQAAAAWPQRRPVNTRLRRPRRRLMGCRPQESQHSRVRESAPGRCSCRGAAKTPGPCTASARPRTQCQSPARRSRRCRRRRFSRR